MASSQDDGKVHNIVVPLYYAGLGNQLFMIARAMSYAKKYNKQMVIERKDYGGSRPSYWHNFLIGFSHYLVPKLPSGTYAQFTELEHQEYNYVDVPNYDNIIFQGYFQHPDYVKDVREEFMETLRYDLWVERIARECKQIPDLADIDFSRSCSLHYRLGDCKAVQHKHPILDDEYFLKCLARFDNTNIDTYLIYCEMEDYDEVKTRVDRLNLKGKVVFVCKYNFADYIELILMSMSRVNLIANSTFSWMSAFFNKHTDKIVFYPELWIRGKTLDIGCKEWNRVLLDQK